MTLEYNRRDAQLIITKQNLIFLCKEILKEDQIYFAGNNRLWCLPDICDLKGLTLSVVLHSSR